MSKFNLEETDDVIKLLKDERDYFGEPLESCLTGVECIKAWQQKANHLDAALARLSQLVWDGYEGQYLIEEIEKARAGE